MKNSYTNPKLFPSDRGLNKLWFVAFRYTNPETGERKQFQFRGEINRHHSKLDRIKEGNSLSNALHGMLQEEWNRSCTISGAGQKYGPSFIPVYA